MSRASRGAEIDESLLSNIDAHPNDLVRVVCETLDITRPAVLTRLHALVASGYLKKSGTTRPIYLVGSNRRKVFHYRLKGLAEDNVWSRDVRPVFSDVAPSILEACQHGLTEMLNNAIDHSGGKKASVQIDINAKRIALVISDDGVGIFNKIARHLHLPDERLALLELSKGKFTTDPSHHSGEGVFFTSRMFDTFRIVSGRLTFDHSGDVASEIPAERITRKPGTKVLMEIRRNHKQTVGDVFREYSSGPDDYTFARTEIPVRLMRLGDEGLISRSQAKRLLERVDRFKTVVLDFSEIDSVGQAFADEIFRVFARAHPDIELIPVHATTIVQQMINRAVSSSLTLPISLRR